MPLGALAGYRRGRMDAVIMRVVDLFLAFPPLLLAMAIVAALGPGPRPRGAGADDLVVAVVRPARPRDGELAARAAVRRGGALHRRAATPRILRRHIVPNAMTPILVQATIDIGTVSSRPARSRSSASARRRPPPTGAYGRPRAATYILDQWWLSTFPGPAIFLAVLGFNLVGDLLVDLLDPRSDR